VNKTRASKREAKHELIKPSYFESIHLTNSAELHFKNLMTKGPTLNVSREQLIKLLNEDLAGEYQAIIAYTVYSQVLKGAAYTDIAREWNSMRRKNCSTP